MFQDEYQVIEHGLLVLSGCAAEVAQEAATRNNHFVGGVLKGRSKVKAMEHILLSVLGILISDFMVFEVFFLLQFEPKTTNHYLNLTLLFVFGNSEFRFRILQFLGFIFSH